MSENQKSQNPDRTSTIRELLENDTKEVVGYLAWDQAVIKGQIVRALETGGITKAQRYIAYLGDEIQQMVEASTLKKVFELLEINENET